MLEQIFRGVTDGALVPYRSRPVVERAESRSSLAALDAQVSFGGMSRQPESLQEFVASYGDVVPVYRCSSLNAASVASLRLRWYRDLGNDEREEVPRDHPVAMIFRRPNPRMSARRWVYATQLGKELTGATYSEIFPLVGSAQLWPLNSSLVDPTIEKRRGVVGYKYHASRPPEEFTAEEIWSDTFYSMADELRGMAPLRPARRAVEADSLLDDGTNAMLRNGMRLGGVLHVDHEATEPQVNHLIAQMREMLAGVRNWGKTLVAAGGRKFEALNMTPEAIQADSLRSWNTGNIMRAYGVWPVIFGLVDQSATRENATTQLLLYHWLTVMPRAQSLAEEISERLLPMLAAVGVPDTEDLFCEFDDSTSPVVRQLRLEEARANATLLERGVYTANEVRSELGYDPVAWGDTFWGSSNTVDVGSTVGGIGFAVARLRAAAGLPASPLADKLLADLATTDDPMRRTSLLVTEAARGMAEYARITGGVDV